MHVAPGTVIDDRYEVLGVLGRGAMAVVYQARHLQLGSLHAVKVLLLPTFAVQQRLRQEGRIQGALRHPNVVGVTDQVDVHGAPGLVMELVQGPSLDRLLALHTLSIDQARALGVGILRGVVAAHELGLIHRDLKPANVLLSMSGDAPVPKIADFGLAKLLRSDGEGSSGTRSGTALGTPSYMAPEQIRDASTVDERADVFALGALLYELVTGTRAFAGADMLEIFQRVARGEVRPLDEVAPDLPEGMGRAIEGALTVDRDDRLPTTAAMLALWAADAPDAVVAEAAWAPELVAELRALAPEARPELSAAVGADTFDIDAPNATWQTPPPTDRMPLSVESGAQERGATSSPRRSRVVTALAGLGGLTLAGLVALLLGGVVAGAGVGWWWWNTQPLEDTSVQLIRGQGFRPDAVPRVSDDPAVQTRFDDAWDRFLHGDLEGAETEARALLRETEDHPAVRLLLVASLIRDDPRIARAELDSPRKTGGRLLNGLLDAVHGDLRLEALGSLLARHPEEVLGRWLLAHRSGVPVETRQRILEELTDLVPTFAPAWAQRIDLALRTGDPSEAMALVEAAEAEPGNAEHVELIVARAHVHLHEGRPERTADLLRQVLDARGPRVEGPLVAALVMLGEDDAVAALAEDQVERSATARARFASWRGEALLGLGRVGEAEAVLDDALVLEGARRPQALDLVRLRITAARLVATPEALQAGLDALTVAEQHVEPEARELLEPPRAVLEGLLAGSRGDLEAVEQIVAEMEARGASARQRAVVIAARDAARDGMVDASRLDLQRCMQRYWAARWQQRGRPEDLALWSEVVLEDSPCGWFGADRYARADALAHMAEHTLQAGSPDDARATLDRYRALWRYPDPGLEPERIAARVDEALALR